MTTKSFIIITILITLAFSVSLFFIQNHDDADLNPNDSRNRMTFDSSTIPIPDTTGALPEASPNYIKSDDNQNDKLIKILPVETEHFSMVKGREKSIIVTTKGIDYKQGLLEFYTWLEIEGYDRIDLSRVKINSDN